MRLTPPNSIGVAARLYCPPTLVAAMSPAYQRTVSVASRRREACQRVVEATVVQADQHAVRPARVVLHQLRMQADERGRLDEVGLERGGALQPEAVALHDALQRAEGDELGGVAAQAVTQRDGEIAIASRGSRAAPGLDRDVPAVQRPRLADRCPGSDQVRSAHVDERRRVVDRTLVRRQLYSDIRAAGGIVDEHRLAAHRRGAMVVDQAATVAGSERGRRGRSGTGPGPPRWGSSAAPCSPPPP